MHLVADYMARAYIAAMCALQMWLVSAMDTLSKDMASGTPHVPSSESAPDRSSAPAGSGDTAASEAQPGIRAVLGLHENVCTGAADGYARMARAPAAVILHLGPGLSNGFANLHNARRARSPVLCLVGDMVCCGAFGLPCCIATHHMLCSR